MIDICQWRGAIGAWNSHAVCKQPKAVHVISSSTCIKLVCVGLAAVLLSLLLLLSGDVETNPGPLTALTDLPTVRELAITLKDLVMWERFALQFLDIETQQIEIIKRESPQAIEDQKIQLFSYLLRMCPSASWEDVIHALERVGENAIARDIRREYSTEEPKVILDELVASLRQCIVDVLTSHFATLRSITELALPDLAAHLLSSGIIAAHINNNPSYYTISTSFEAGLNFLDSREDISDYCGKYFAAFYSCGGPLRLAADKVKQDITEKVREKLGIDFIIQTHEGLIHVEPPIDPPVDEPPNKNPEMDEPDGSSIEEDDAILQLLKTEIAGKGELNLRIVKGIFFGPPNVGKTIVSRRLTGRFRNLASEPDTFSESTGIDNPVEVHLYHDTLRSTMLIHKDWSTLDRLQDQLEALVHLITNRDDSKTVTSSGKKDTSNDTHYLDEANPPNNPNTVNPMETEDMHDFSKLEMYKAFLSSHQNMLQSIVKEMKEITLFQIIDCGGQPEFFEILPLLLQGPCLALIFISLVQSLDRPFQVSFRADQNSKSSSYTSSFSQLEMVQMLLAAIHSLNCTDMGEEHNSQSAASIIGTYYDKESAKANLEKYEHAIEQSLKQSSFYEQDLLKRTYKGSFIFPVDNVNGDESEMTLLRVAIEDIIMNSYEFPSEPLPTSWGIYHLCLRHKFESQGICSLEEAVEVASHCGIMEENVKKVLKYFRYRFGTILHYHEVKDLESLVIINPNIIFRPITKLVAESFGINNPHTQKAERVRSTGEIEFNVLETFCSNCPGRQNVSLKQIVSLLKHFHIISEVTEKKCIFMSCLLSPYPLKEESQEILTRNPASLLIYFSCDHVPVSLFHVLVAKLLVDKRFELDKKRYKNCIGFIYDGSVEVELISWILFLEIRVENNPRLIDSNILIELKDTILLNIQSTINEVKHMRSTCTELGFYCPKSFEGTNRKLHHALLDERQQSLVCKSCREGKNTLVELEEKHIFWLKSERIGQRNIEDVDCGDTTYPPLQTSDVFCFLRHKADDWYGIGRQLRISIGERNCLKKDTSLSEEDRLENIIELWIEKAESRRTWDELKECLERLEFNEVLRNVQDFLKKRK